MTFPICKVYNFGSLSQILHFHTVIGHGQGFLGNSREAKMTGEGQEKGKCVSYYSYQKHVPRQQSKQVI